MKAFSKVLSLFFTLILIFSITISLVQAAGACVNNVDLSCFADSYDTAEECASDFGYALENVTFYEGFSCTGNRPAFLSNGGCCCIDPYDPLFKNGNNQSAVVRDSAACADVLYAESRFFPEYRTTSTCTAFCQSNPDLTQPETIEQQCADVGVWCPESSTTGSQLPNIDLTNQPAGQICVLASECTVAQDACTNEDFSIQANEYCPTGFGKGSGSNACCSVQPLKTQCEGPAPSGLGGTYCPLNVGPAASAGCQVAADIIPARLIGNTSGSSGGANTCCANGCYVPPPNQRDYEFSCNDGVDNDGDGAIDEDDSQCDAIIRGQVTPPGAGQFVQLKAKSNQELVAHSIFADANGYYEFSNLARNATYTVSVVGFNIDSKRVDFDMTPNRIEEPIDFVVDSRNITTVTGFIKGEDGERVSNAFIIIDGTEYSTISDSNGYYVLPNVRRSLDYTMSVYATSYYPNTTNLPLFSLEWRKNVTLTSTICDTSADPIELRAVSHIKGEKKAKLEWGENKCSQSVSAYTVYRKCIPILSLSQSDDSCTGEFDVIAVTGADPAGFDNSDTSYVDDTVSWEYKYEYLLSTTYNAQETQNSSSKNITLGVALCEGRGVEEFCGYHTDNVVSFVNNRFQSVPTSEYYGGLRCDAQNRIIRENYCGIGGGNGDLPKTCVEYDDARGIQQTQCVDSSVCVENSRSNPFGFFSSDRCEGEDNYLCYTDKGQTSVDTCLLCKPEMTCGDYRTQSACSGSSGDVCGVAKSAAGCVWESIDDTLGIGVCKDTAISQCESCNNGGGAFGACDALSCSKYSNADFACGYSETTFECSNLAELTCYDFATSSSCPVGKDVPASCKFGPGYGSDTMCFKDSDADNNDDCAPENLEQQQYITVAQCRADNIPPQTRILATGGYDSDILFGVIDIGSPVTQTSVAKATYYCIDAGQGRCNNYNSDFFYPVVDNRLQVPQSMLEDIRSATFDLYYYSIDHANNREEIQTYSFDFDTNPPRLASALEIRSDYDPRQKTSSGVISFNITRQGSCTFDVVLDEESSIELRPSSGLSLEHTFIFNGLADGSYKASIVCTSGDGYTSEPMIRDFVINGDERMFDIQPLNKGVDVDVVEISLKTAKQVECRYEKIVNYGDSFVFDSMDPLNNLTRTPESNYYKHNFSVTELDTGQYSYFVACDFSAIDPVDTQAQKVITFTYDKRLPAVSAVYTNDVPYDFTLAKKSHQIKLLCEDYPANGFGCAGVRYCLEPYYAYQGEAELSCSPDTLVDSGTVIPITTSSTFCYEAVENVNPGYGGGKSSGVECERVIAQEYKTEFVFSSFPDITDTRNIFIDGAVYIISYDQDALVFTPVANTNNAVFDAGDELLYKNMILRAKVDVSQALTSQGTMDFVVRADNTDNGFAVRFNFLDAQNPILSVINTRASTTPLATPISLNEFNLTEELELLIKVVDSTLTVSIGDQTTVAQLSGTPVAGALLVKLTGNTEVPNFAVSEYKITDLSSVTQRVSMTVTPYERDIVTGGRTLSASSSTPYIVTADPYFTHTLQLTQIPRLLEDMQFQVKLTATNNGGQESIPFVKDVYFDTTGPKIESVSFDVVTRETPDQQFLISGQDARVTISAYDLRGSVEKLFIEVDEIYQEVDIESQNGNVFVGIISTAGFSNTQVGQDHDVLVFAEDELGNRGSRLFENKLRIDPPVNFPQLSLKTPFYINNDTGGVSYTVEVIKNFPILDGAGAQVFACNATYTDKNGDPASVELTPLTNDFKMTVTIPSNSLGKSANAEVITPVRIRCTQTTGQLVEGPNTFYQEIVFDQKLPLFGLLPVREDLVRIQVDDFSQTFAKHDSAPEVIRFIATEPVHCSFVNASGRSSFTPRTISHFAESNRSKMLNIDANPKTFEVICKDQANNFAASSEFIIFANRTNDAVYIYDALPVGYTNDQPVVASVIAYNADSCKIDWAGDGSNYDELTLVADLSAREAPLYQRSFSQLSEGSYTYEIFCPHTDVNGDDGSISQTIVVDRTAPLLAIEMTDVTSIRAINIPLNASMSEKGIIRIEGNSQQYAEFDVNQNQGIPSGYAIPLDFGPNTLIITAIDQAGNENSTTRTIFREPNGVSLKIDGLGGTIVGKIPTVRVFVDTVGYQLSTLTFNATIRNESGVVESYPSLSAQSNSPITFSKEMVLGDGKYTIDVYARSTTGDIVGQTSAVLTVNKYTPTNTIYVPQEFASDYDEEILAVTDHKNVLIPSLDTITVTRDGSDNPISAQDITRRDANLTGTPNYFEGRSIVDVSSTNDIGFTGTAYTSTIFDVLGPQIAISLVGSTEAKTRSSFPRFDISFVNELGKISDMYIIRDGATSLSGVTRLRDYPQGEFISSLRPIASTELGEDGLYRLMIEVEDYYGNIAYGNYPFESERGDINGTLIYPSFGITNKSRDLFVFETDREAVCRYTTFDDVFYADMIDITTTENGRGVAGIVHTIPDLNYPSIPLTLYAQCTSPNGGSNNQTYAIAQEIVLDATRPNNLTLSLPEADEGIIRRDLPLVRLNAVTDDKTFCAYGETADVNFDDPSRVFESSERISTTNYVRIPMGGQKVEKRIYVVCQNGAGEYSDVENILIKKDVDSLATITILSPRADLASREGNITISIQTKERANYCQYTLNDNAPANFVNTNTNRTLFSTNSLGLSEGKYEFTVNCFVNNQDVTTATRSFFVDSTPPEFEKFRVANETTTTDELSVRYDFTDALSGVAQYKYTLGIAKYGTTGFDSLINISDTRRNRINEDDLNLSDDEIYYWSVQAIDFAGNKGPWISTNGTLVTFPPDTIGGVINPGSSQTCFDGIKNQDETGVDCGGLLCGKCGTDQTCGLSGDCLSNNCVAGFCEAPTCTDGVRNGLETDVDCGGLTCGSTCAISKRCTQANDCVNGTTCGGGFCVDAHCSNTILDKDETDVDCGGSCSAACAQNKKCLLDSDCQSGLCSDSGVCADPQTLDTDKDGMPDYWEKRHSLDHTNPADAARDADGDGMTNLQEYNYISPYYGSNGQLNPNNPDTDGDEVDDGKEVNKDYTDPTDPSDYNKALHWSIWLLLFILLLLLIIGGYYGYTYYQDNQSRQVTKTTTQTQTQTRTFSPQMMGQQPQRRSLHDELKKSLSERIAREKKLSDEGHPVFAKEQGDAPKENDSAKTKLDDATHVREIVEVEETEEILRQKAQQKKEAEDNPFKRSNDESDDLKPLMRSGSALDTLSKITEENKPAIEAKKSTNSLEVLAGTKKAEDAKKISASKKNDDALARLNELTGKKSSSSKKSSTLGKSTTQKTTKTTTKKTTKKQGSKKKK